MQNEWYYEWWMAYSPMDFVMAAFAIMFVIGIILMIVDKDELKTTKRIVRRTCLLLILAIETGVYLLKQYPFILSKKMQQEVERTRLTR